MKASAIVRIIIYSLVILILVSILLGCIMAGKFLSTISFGTTIANGHVESVGSVTASEIRELDIEWVAGSITIQTGDTDEITFSENSGLDDENKMVWKQTGSKLAIQFCKPKVFFGITIGFNSDYSKDLVITIPDDWQAWELNIDSVSANIDISDLNTERLYLTNVSGRCTLRDCTTTDVEVETVSGRVDYTGSLLTLNLESVSADCTLDLDAGARDINMGCVSGNLTLYLPEDQGFTATVDGVSGDITTDFATTVSGGIHTFGDGSCSIEGECVSGDIIIRKAAHTHTWDEGVVHDVPGDKRQELVYTCTVCGETKSEPYDNSAVFTVSYANSFTEEMLLEPLMTGYCAGTTVTVKTDILTDVDLELYVDGVFICRQTEVLTAETHHWEFAFIMPEHDVTIQLKTSDGM